MDGWCLCCITMRKHKHPTLPNVSATKDGYVFIDNRPAKIAITTTGYETVWVPMPRFITATGIVAYGKSRKVHQLVFECITKKVPKYSSPGLCINHIDNNRRNNVPSNLELTTTDRNTALGKQKKYVIRDGKDIYFGCRTWTEQFFHGRSNRLINGFTGLGKRKYSNLEILGYQEPYGNFVALEDQSPVQLKLV